MVKKLLTWAGFGFLVFFVSFHSAGAAQTARWIGGGLVNMANGFSDFVAAVFQ
jgi:hypothetical protein